MLVVVEYQTAFALDPPCPSRVCTHHVDICSAPLGEQRLRRYMFAGIIEAEDKEEKGLF